MTSLPAVISLQGVGFTYPEGERPALENVTFDVHQGEWVALVGGNGSGKSTLARLLNALLLPTQGVVCVAGIPTTDESRVWDVRRTLSMVFQNPENQIVSSIVEDDVAFGPENLGLPQAEIRHRVDSALEVVGLKELANREVHTLSGGQKQRLAIGGALAMGGQCMVLDEPTAMLDPQGREEVMHLLAQLKKRGHTLVHITHHMDEIEQADRVILLHQGQKVWEGTPAELLARDDLESAFGLYKTELRTTRDQLQAAGLLDKSVPVDAKEMAAALCQLK